MLCRLPQPYWIALLGTILFFPACEKDKDADKNTIRVVPGPNAQAELQTAFIEMPEGTTILLSEGTYTFNSTLSITNKRGVTIRGAGRNRTFLVWSDQTAGGGGEGLSIKADNLRLEGFTVRNTRGDGIKVRESNRVTFQSVGVEWTAGPNSANGAYGLYPVLCNHVLMDDCYARAASDAGIYVGQSRNVIVRNCLAEENVAGIEIENTFDADVYNNTARNNTGGILIFDLPGLVLKNGGRVRVYNNQILDNRQANFAPPGNIVGQVPAGTGVMILGVKDVQIFGNTISGNNSVSVAIMSYATLGALAGILAPGTPNPFPNTDPAYNAYTGGVSVFDNSFIGAMGPPDTTVLMGSGLYSIYADAPPHIAFDGASDDADKENNEVRAERRICVRNNSGNPTFGNLLAALGLGGSADIADYDCSLPALPTVTVDAP